jgi:hypothetical protein
MLVPQYKLVVNYIPYSGSIIMDTYKDEDLLLSNNLTEITEVDQIPYSLTRTFQLPGSNKNNAFFQHAYDISIEEPYLFASNAKVPCYVDFGGLVVVDGYLQLNKIVMLDQEIVDYYEVTIFGTLNKFAKDLNTTYLNDLDLSAFNHTSSLANITSSWAGNLFSGSVVYPMADYGTKLIYSPQEGYTGIDAPDSGMTIQDWKPAIRIKDVWDAVFRYSGYTYTSNFFTQSWLDSVYMVANRSLRYPVYYESGSTTLTSSLETFGLCKISAVSGSGQTNVTMSVSTPINLPWYNIQYNPSGAIDSSLYYTASASPFVTKTNIRGNISLTFELKANAGISALTGVPLFSLNYGSDSLLLGAINNYMREVKTYNESGTGTGTKTEKYTVSQEFNFPNIVTGSAERWGLEYSVLGTNNFSVVIDPGNDAKSYLEVTKTCFAADLRTFDMALNMPYGQTGIKLIDFIKGIQRKFNLVIYPDKDNFNNFIVEEFNDWYKQGVVLNLNQYVDLNNGMEVIPANSLAVNKLGFSDKLDSDYVSQQFRSKNGREYGKQSYIDTVNDFSSGEYNVVSTFSSAPLVYLNGTGLSGSVGQTTLYVNVQETYQGSVPITCSYDGSISYAARYRLTATLKDSGGTDLASNPYGDFIIPMLFDRSGTPCSMAFSYNDYFIIPFGSTTSYIDYVDQGYDVCFGCSLYNDTPNCVGIASSSIPPNTTLYLYGSSDYPQC